MGTQASFAALAFGILTGCGGGVAQSPASQQPVLAPLAPHAPPDVPFTPPAANPARKAKLLAVASQLDELYRARLAEVGATGGAVAVLLEGEVVYLRGFGVRDVVSKAPVDPDTVLRLDPKTSLIADVSGPRAYGAVCAE
jgi:Beta-lactamase